jgi:hypothetical protein
MMRLGWVDFSREARKRAFEALAALSEPGAVDELGFGTLRDAFADALFPGTSTLQTRAKYFVLVPCAIRYALENKQALRQVERECCRQMWITCGHSREAGVIGNRGLNNGVEWIQRPPSEIYWAGLRKLGILHSPLSSGLWFTHARHLVDETGGSAIAGDDGQEGVLDDRETVFSGWKHDFAFPWKTLYRDFCAKRDRRELSPDLTPDEAAFLDKRILEADGTRGTFLAWCLEHGRLPRADEVVDDGKAPSAESLSPFFRFARSVRRHVPEDIGKLLDGANALNRLVFPARVLHNRILAAHPRAEEIWHGIESEVSDWAKEVDLPAIFALFPGRIPNPLDVFLRDLQDAFRNGNILKAEHLVAKREKDLKPGRAKVLHPEKLPPGKWVGGGWLDYRLPQAGRILRDIAVAKGTSDA